MDDLAVEILRCHGCGAPVPLGAGDVVTCPHCGSEVAVPDAHQALRRALAEGEDRRRQAEVVVARLDRPAPFLVKVLAATLDLPMLAFLVVYGLPLSLVSVLFGIRVSHGIAERTGLPAGDDMPMWLVFTTILALVTATTFVPRALGVYANRRMSARRHLLAALEARPPTTPGGPSGCRNCGAPLDVPEGARVARCPYCQAESALRLDTTHLAAARGHSGQLGRSIADALPRDRAERRATLRMLGKEAGRYVLTGGAFALLFGIYGWDTDRVGDTTEVPGLGLGALVLATFLLIGLIMRSLAGSAARRTEAEARRSGNDVPGWVRVVGPMALLALLWAVTRVGSCGGT